MTEAKRGAGSGVRRAPRLAAVSTGALLVTPVRAVVGAAILSGAVAEGLPRASAAIAIGAGATLFAFAAASSRRRVLLDDLAPAPADAEYCAWWQSGIRAALPSTVVLTVLGTASLAFSRGTSAVCGGLLVGMAITGFGLGMLLLVSERRERRRLYVDWSILQPHRFVAPR